MITVDRLALKLTGLSSVSGEPLARRIADRLAAAELKPERDVALGEIQRTITSNPGETQDELADRIADAILESLARSIT